LGEVLVAGARAAICTGDTGAALAHLTGEEVFADEQSSRVLVVRSR
jgi:hypothetical protein